MLTGLAAALIPAWITHDLKRILQPNWYIGLGVIYFVVCAFVIFLAFRLDENVYLPRWRLLTLLGLVALPNLVNIWIRTTAAAPNGLPGSLFGRDGDVQLFYSYGHQFASGLYPRNFQGQYMEYPQFALLFFLVGAVLAGNLDTFVWLFPVLMLILQIGAAFALYGIGLKQKNVRAAYLMAVIISTCPFIFGFAFTRFDIAPTALLIIGIYFFLPSQKKTNHPSVKLNKVLVSSELTAGGIVAGALSKWLPAIAWPALLFVYIRRKLWVQLWVFVEVSVGLSALVMLPFYFWNSSAFWYPYQYQGSRHMIGESFWFLIQNWLLDPTHAVPDKPWAEPSQILLGNNKLLIAQLALTMLVFGLGVWRLWRVRDQSEWSRWAGVGLTGVAVFTLANRVFSPQYIILLIWVWAAVLILKKCDWKVVLVGAAGIITGSAANFLTFLLGAYPDGWVVASAIFFGTGWLLSAWILYRLLIQDRNDQAKTPA